MKRRNVQRSILSLGMILLAGFPLGTAWGAAPALSAASSPTVHAAAATKTFKGTVEQMQQWGPIQVSILVKSKKITKVLVAATAHTDHSVSIQNNALPILKQETLKAQSAKINEVSGATDTSGAYITSLQNAVKKARKAKALK